MTNDSRKLVYTILARRVPCTSKLPCLRLSMDYSGANISYRCTMAILRYHRASQVRHPGCGIGHSDILVRRIHSAPRLFERSGVLWTCVLGGKGICSIWSI